MWDPVGVCIWEGDDWSQNESIETPIINPEIKNNLANAKEYFSWFRNSHLIGAYWGERRLGELKAL